MSLKEKIDAIYEKEKEHSTDIWINSDFKNFAILTNDGKGKVGEEFISELFHDLVKEYPDYEIKEDISDINIKEDNKHYDININNIKIEVKTSGLGSSKSEYQHENIYTKEFCDMTIFVDINPIKNKIFLSVIPEDQIPFKDIYKKYPIFNGRKQTTLRQNRDNAHKLDFSNRSLTYLLENNYCIELNSKENNTRAVQFLKERIDEFCGNYF